MDVNRWAVIIGVSEYAYLTGDLEYADDDARALYELIQTPSAGGFPEENILLLTNQDATTRGVTRALRSFLKKPAREDIVIVYFAGHGAPDPDRPDNLYLLTHDTEPDDIAGTALPMRELQVSIIENLLAERVVVIADACHSAGVGTGRRANFDPATVVNNYLAYMADAKPGMALLTSAEALQTAQEGAQWADEDYPGHGVFTYYLLRGMEGEADGFPRDGIVTVGELFEFVRERVKEATGDQQHPAIGTAPFDRELPIAITATIAAEEHFALGERLLELGWLAQAPGRFESAARQYQEALRMVGGARVDFPEASLGLARSLIALEDYEGATRELERLVAASPDAPAEAIRLLGMARALEGNTDGAVAAFERLVDEHDGDPYAPLARAYLQERAVDGGEESARRALLIAASEYDHHEIRFPGTENDLRRLEPLLRDVLGFDRIRIIAGQEATRAQVLEALRELEETTRAGDVVLVHYSGWGTQPDDAGRSGLVLRDSKVLQPDFLGTALTPQQLHDALNRIPAGRVLVSFDGILQEELVETVRTGADYTLMTAGSPGELVYEVAGDDGLQYGAWSLALVKAIETSAPDAPVDEIFFRARTWLDERATDQQTRQQTPLLLGSRVGPAFEPNDWIETGFRVALRGGDPRLTVGAIRETYDRTREFFGLSGAVFHTRFGEAFLSRGAARDAAAAFDASSHATPPLSARDEVLHGIALTRAQEYTRGGDLLARMATSPEFSSGVQTSLQTAGERVSSMGRDARHALLVGISAYPNLDTTVVGPLDDVRAMERVLIDRYGFDDVRVLVDEQATGARILEEFRRLAEVSRNEPGLFYFAGIGALNRQADGLALVPVDAREPPATPGVLEETPSFVQDITLRELAALAPHDSTNLIAVFDAFSGDRLTTPDEGPAVATRGIGFPDPDWTGLAEPVGHFTLYASLASKRAPIARSATDLPDSQAPPGAVPDEVGECRPSECGRGNLTRALVSTLRASLSEPTTYRELLDILASISVPDRVLGGSSSRIELAPVAVGQDVEVPLFGHASWMTAVATEPILTAMRQGPLTETVNILRRLIDERNGNYPEGHLNLGVAYAELGNAEQSIESLERALAQSSIHDTDARYHLGRVLAEEGVDLERAVSELRHVAPEHPMFVASRLYFGQALRTLVERELLTEVKTAFEAYLAGGATLGRTEEVREWIKELRDTEAEPQLGSEADGTR